MEGSTDNPAMRGIIPNSFQQIFDAVSAASHDAKYLVRASFLEIYAEQVYDLLTKTGGKALEVRENSETGFFVKDLTTVVVKNVAGQSILIYSHFF